MASQCLSALAKREREPFRSKLKERCFVTNSTVFRKKSNLPPHQDLALLSHPPSFFPLGLPVRCALLVAQE